MFLPGLSPASSCLVVPVTLVETSALLSRGSESPALSVLVNWFDNPVDPSVTPNCLVVGVNEDNLVVLVGGILVDPVGVKDSEIGAATADTLLRGGAERTLVLELVHTLVCGLTIGGTFRNWSLAASAADADAVDHVALLGLVAETASLIGARWPAGTVNNL